MENQSAIVKEMEEKIQNICIKLSKYDVETIVISVDVKNKVSNSYGSKIACEFLSLKRNVTKQFLNFLLEYDEQQDAYKEGTDENHLTKVDIMNSQKDETKNPLEDTDPEDDSFSFRQTEIGFKTSKILDENQLNLTNPVSKRTENVICESIHSAFQKVQQTENKDVHSRPLHLSALSQQCDLVDQTYSLSQLQNNVNVKMSSDVNGRGNIRTELNYNNTMETSETFVLPDSLPLEQNQFEQSCPPLQSNSSLLKSCDTDSEHYICGNTEGTDTVIIMTENFSSGGFLYLDEIGFPSDVNGKFGDSKGYHGNITIDIVSDRESEALDHEGNSVENDTPENLGSQEMCIQNVAVTTNKYEDLPAVTVVQNRGDQCQGHNLEQGPLLVNFQNRSESRSGNFHDILVNSYGRGSATTEMTGLINVQVLDTDQGQCQGSQKGQTVSGGGKVHVHNVGQDPSISIESVSTDIRSEETVKVQGQIIGIDSESPDTRHHELSKTLHSQITVDDQNISMGNKMDAKIQKQQELLDFAVSRGNYKGQAQVLDCDEMFPDVKSAKKKSFNKDTELVDVFGKQPYKCSICGVRFTKLKNLYNHKKKMHAPGVVRFRCDRCGTSYRSQESLDKHNLLHSIVEGTDKMIQCNVNGKVREAPKEDKYRGIQKEIVKNREMQDECRDSQSIYVEGNNREQDRKSRSTQNIDCIKETNETQDEARNNTNGNIGENQLYDRSELSSVKNHEKSQAFDNKKDKLCDTENLQSCDFDNLKDFNKSCDKIREEIDQKSIIKTRKQRNCRNSGEKDKRQKRKVCKVDDAQMSDLVTESEIHQCEICHSKFNRLKNLKEHLKKVHNLFFKCSACSLTFASEELLSKHQSENCGNKGLKCIICGKIFAKRYNMQRHMTMIHSNEEGFKCEKCNKTFKTKDGLKRHLNTHLTMYKCTECNREFLMYIEMVRHKAAAHKKEQLLMICSVCGKRFQSHQRLVIHLRTHSTEKPFECHICQKQYKSNESLKIHGLTHLRSKSHLCDVCGKDFIHKTSLVIHKKSHSIGRYTKCQYCNKVLASKEGLHSHMVAFHSSHVDFKNRTYHHCTECSKIFTDKHRYLKHKLIHSGEKPFKCDVCKRCFNHPRNLKTHMSTHNKIKPYSCKDCGNTFMYKKDLLRHVKYNYCKFHRDSNMTESPADTHHVKVVAELS